MAGRVNQIDKAIASLESDIAVLNKAIETLRAQQGAKPAAKAKQAKAKPKVDKGLNAQAHGDNGE